MLVAPGVRLEVFHDTMAIWSKPEPNAVRGRQDPDELIALVLGAYALITRITLDWSLDGWVVATGARFDGTTMGVVVDPRGHNPMLSRAVASEHGHVAGGEVGDQRAADAGPPTGPP